MGAGIIFIAGIVGVTWLLADALDAVDAQVEEIFGLETWVPEELEAAARDQAGGGSAGSRLVENDARTHRGEAPTS